ncbi:MAG TPA: PilZ domain-containing protein [Candidatus Acidoferrum sp.]|nr:PilZ domain-containing protein [Candidatus Acidoferrum sp.]
MGSLSIALDEEHPASSPDSPSGPEPVTSSSDISEHVEDLTSALNLLTEAEQLAISRDIAEQAEKFLKSADLARDVEKLATSPNIPSRAETPAAPSVAPTGADRRTHPRYEFIASAEIVAAESGARIAMRVRDLSQQGCYVDTSDALPLGTVTDVRITKGAQRFEARARVVYSRVATGMGLMFTAVAPEHLQTLDSWLAESRETSWLAANRRRSQRVLVTIPVRVSGQLGAGASFQEETHTRAISAHGALILLSAQVHRGQRLTLSNVQTKAALECVVAHIDRHQKDQPQIGVEFALPNPTFWHVAFPPKDWTPRHPHAKSQAKSREST